MQHPDGSWGCFHTLRGNSDTPMTTETALLRLELLGYTAEEGCIKRAITHMQTLLHTGELPEGNEKTSDSLTNFLVLDQPYGDVLNVRGTLINTNGPTHSVHEIHFRCRKITRNIHYRRKITLAGARGTLYHLYILFAYS